VRYFVVELIGVGLDNERTAEPMGPDSETVAVSVAPLMLEAAPAMCSKVGSYNKVKLAEVTFSPLLNASGIPALAMLLGTLIVASELETPELLDDNN
jgi:hypothetical protein